MTGVNVPINIQIKNQRFLYVTCYLFVLLSGTFTNCLCNLRLNIAFNVKSRSQSCFITFKNVVQHYNVNCLTRNIYIGSCYTDAVVGLLGSIAQTY